MLSVCAGGVIPKDSASKVVYALRYAKGFYLRLRIDELTYSAFPLDK
jgi:hypothetical protein